MIAPRRYAAVDGSFTRSAGSAAARGGVLIALAIAIGFALLAWGFDGGESDAVSDADDTSGDTSDDTSGDAAGNGGEDDDGGGAADDETIASPSEDETNGGDPVTTGDDQTETVAVDPPSTVNVVVLNGTGRQGLASSRGDALGSVGYVWTGGNAASFTVDESKVYYTAGYSDEAKQVAEALSGSAAVLEQAPSDPTTLADEEASADAAAADIIVVLGTDGALS